MLSHAKSNSSKIVFTLSREKYHTWYGKGPDSSNTIIADLAGGNRLRPIIMTGRPIRAVTRRQVVGESASQPSTEKSYKCPSEKYTEQAPPTSSPEHESAEHPTSSSSASTATITTAPSHSISTMTTSASSSTAAAAPATTAAKTPANTAASSATTVGTTAVSAMTTVPHCGRMQPFRQQQITRHLLFKLSQQDRERKESSSTRPPEASSAAPSPTSSSSIWKTASSSQRHGLDQIGT